MVLKHWQGYGRVKATKISNIKTTSGVRVLTIKVQGNHEWGLERDDTYDLYNWLVRRFAKDCKDYTAIKEYGYTSGYENGEDTCTYTFKYSPTE